MAYVTVWDDTAGFSHRCGLVLQTSGSSSRATRCVSMATVRERSADGGGSSRGVNNGEDIMSGGQLSCWIVSIAGVGVLSRDAWFAQSGSGRDAEGDADAGDGTRCGMSMQQTARVSVGISILQLAKQIPRRPSQNSLSSHDDVKIRKGL